jgi:hypothetical protein
LFSHWEATWQTAHINIRFGGVAVLASAQPGAGGAKFAVGDLQLRARGAHRPEALGWPGLARQATAHLETRLRCLCGARRARLEIRGLAEAPAEGAGGIYVFQIGRYFVPYIRSPASPRPGRM